MTTLEGRSVLITGASGAIGAEVARCLAARGARLALSARRRERLAALADDVAAAGGVRPAVLVADLGQRGQAVGLAERAVDALGGVEVLISNAGASVQGLTWVVGDRDEAREVLETNLWSPFALVAALTPRMLDQGGGAIVNVGSMAQVSPFPHLGHYAASRAALAVATQVLQLELGPRGVRVVEVALGPVDTPASRENRALAGADGWLDGRPGLGNVESAAAAIVAAAEGNADGVVFYPRILRWPHRLPGLGRRYSRRAAKCADIEDTTVRLGGSAGDRKLVALRERFEAAQTTGTQ
ncbi:MAG TPA: SDR family oxidoreductase [Candidatus Acidoferrum sp.]|nr:SDR family oxidoreductase [Candidatus Acidoferrum sp.]